MLFISPACPSSLAKPGRGSLSRDIPAEELLSESAPSAPRAAAALQNSLCVMALCHSAPPGDSKSHHLCSPTAASCRALTTTYPSLPPLLPHPLLKASGKEIFSGASCSPGRAVCCLPALLCRSKSFSSDVWLFLLLLILSHQAGGQWQGRKQNFPWKASWKAVLWLMFNCAHCAHMNSAYKSALWHYKRQHLSLVTKRKQQCSKGCWSSA